MAQTLNGIVIVQPSSDPNIAESETFTFEISRSFQGGGPVNSHDIKWEYDDSGGGTNWQTIGGATDLSTADTNPVTGSTSTTNLSITVTGETAGSYDIRCVGDPSGGDDSYNIIAFPQAVTVTSGGITAGNPDALVISETTPSLNVTISAGNPDALVVSEATPARRVDSSRSPPLGALVIAETTSDPLLNHIVAPALDALAFTGETPSLEGNPKPGKGSLSLTGNAPSLGVGIVVPTDSLSITETTPARVVNSTVNPTVGSLVITEDTPSPDKLITAGSPDGLVISETTPVPTAGWNVSPSYYGMRIYSVVGLNFNGHTPTISVEGGGDKTITAGDPDALVISETTSTLNIGISVPADSLAISETTSDPLVNHITAPALDALVISEETPIRIVDSPVLPSLDALVITESSPLPSKLITAGSPDALVISEETPVRLVDNLRSPALDALVISETTPLPSKLITAGSPDALVLNGLQPTIIAAIKVFPGADSLVIAESTPSPDKLITAGSPDALVLNGLQPVASVGLYVGSDALVIASDAPSLNVGISAGSPDALVISGETPDTLGANPVPSADSLALSGLAPSIGIGISVPADSLAISETTSSVGIGIQAGSLDALVISETTSDPLVNHIVAPTVGSAVFSGLAPNLLTPETASPALDALTITGLTPSTGSPVVTPTVGALVFSGKSIATSGGSEGTPIVNTNATTNVPTNIEQCDLSGFKQLPGSLKLTWRHYAVRRKSYDERHPQENVRAVPDKQKGPKRPEQDDAFIEDLYPSGVDPDTDL